MPGRINNKTMERFIGANFEGRIRGEDILLASFNAVGEATAHFDVQAWLEWSIARFGGACGLAAVEWCFDQLGVTRICETTAGDSDRSIRLLSRLGFVLMGEVISIKPDVGTRPSIYWGMSSEGWPNARSLKDTG